MLFYSLQVGQCQFGIDDFDIRGWVNLVGNVSHVVVFEAAHHVSNGIGLADVGEKLIAQAFAFGRAGDQTGDIGELHGGGNDLLGLDDSGKSVQARIGNGTIPELGSMVQNGKFSAAMPALVSALNSVDLPTLGRPTIPHLTAIADSLYCVCNNVVLGSVQQAHGFFPFALTALASRESRLRCLVMMTSASDLEGSPVHS